MNLFDYSVEKKIQGTGGSSGSEDGYAADIEDHGDGDGYGDVGSSSNGGHRRIRCRWLLNLRGARAHRKCYRIECGISEAPAKTSEHLKALNYLE